jgi:diaminopimelate decarboxylase
MAQDLQRIARELDRHQDPIIGYDRAGIEDELDLLKSHLNRAVRGRLSVFVLFSVKANPNLKLLEWLAGQGVGAEVSSMPEYELAQRAGFRLISATSPGLTASNISTLAARGVLLNIDNVSQLQCVPSGTKIGMRLCLPLDLTGNSQTSGYSRFGIMLDDLALEQALRDGNSTVTRLHAHFRDIGNASQLTRLAGYLVAATRRFPQVVEINLGGGMTRLYKDPITAGEAWNQCAPIFDDLRSGSTLIVEPGAQIITKHGYLGTRVVSVTTRPDGRKLVVVDSSKWNLVCWSEYELISPEPTDEGSPTDVVGSTCYEKDVWLANVQLPEVHPGQKLIFRGLGAYVVSLARKMHGLPLPNESLI